MEPASVKQKKPEKGKKPWWMLTVVGLYILTKGKAVLTLLKFGKIGAPLLSMAIAIGTYAIIFPFQFAVGIVILILIHELGHVAAAKQKGLPVSAPFFIPFLGALITMKRHPRDAVTEAYIAMGGPLLGTLGGLLTFWIGWQWEIPLLIVLANAAFFLNLINLLPIHPLDGGRIATAVTRWLWLLGLIGGLIVIYYLKSLLFFLIWLWFAWDLYQKYVRNKKNDKSFEIPFRFEVPAHQLLENGMMIPGESHRRELEFATYSTLEGEQKVEIYWDSIGLRDSTTLPRQMLIQSVQVVGTEHLPKGEPSPERILFRCQIQGVLHENDAYYEVPNAVRWKFGLGYGSLAILLFYMIYLCNKVMSMEGII